MVPKIYLDTCALNRPTDDLSQPRVRQEAEAVTRIFDLLATGRVHWTASTVLSYEIERNPDLIRRLAAFDLLTSASQVIKPDNDAVAWTAELVSRGIAGLDALHLAVARQAGVEWFLTTDDRLLRSAGRALSNHQLIAMNPVDWLQRRFPWLLPHPRSQAK